MAHGVCGSNVPSIIRPAYGLGQAVGYGNALKLRDSTGDLKPTFGQSNQTLSPMLGSKSRGSNALFDIRSRPQTRPKMSNSRFRAST